MKTVKQVAVFAENKLGQMARITEVLSEKGINIYAMTIASSDTFGVIKFLVDKPEDACAALKAKGLTASLNEVLAIEMSDKSGGLFAVAQVLAKNKVNVENASGFVIKPGETAALIIEVKDVAKAGAMLAKENLRFFSQEEIVK